MISWHVLFWIIFGIRFLHRLTLDAQASSVNQTQITWQLCSLKEVGATHPHPRSCRAYVKCQPHDDGRAYWFTVLCNRYHIFNTKPTGNEHCVNASEILQRTPQCALSQFQMGTEALSVIPEIQKAICNEQNPDNATVLSVPHDTSCEKYYVCHWNTVSKQYDTQLHTCPQGYGYMKPEVGDVINKSCWKNGCGFTTADAVAFELLSVSASGCLLDHLMITSIICRQYAICKLVNEGLDDGWFKLHGFECPPGYGVDQKIPPYESKTICKKELCDACNLTQPDCNKKAVPFFRKHQRLLGFQYLYPE